MLLCSTPEGSPPTLQIPSQLCMNVCTIVGSKKVVEVSTVLVVQWKHTKTTLMHGVLSQHVSNTAAEAKVQRTRAQMSAQAENNGVSFTHIITEPVSSTTASSMFVSAMCSLQGRQRCTVSSCNHDAMIFEGFWVSMSHHSLTSQPLPPLIPAVMNMCGNREKPA